MFKDEFLKSLQRYTQDGRRHGDLWGEIEMEYSAPTRFYHTLTHLDDLLYKLSHFRSRFFNWDALVFAIAYHDIVYDVLQTNNEEASASMAVERLTIRLCFPAKEAEATRKMILATRSHESVDDETNLFTDADLSILGSPPDAYEKYTKQIRKEYAPIPDEIYRNGRKNILKKFLGMRQIYKTEEFFLQFEQIARENMQRELEAL